MEKRRLPMSVKEAAKYTNLSPSWLNKARIKGDGPIFIKLGGKVLYAPDDVDEWIESNKRKSTSDTGKKR